METKQGQNYAQTLTQRNRETGTWGQRNRHKNA
jgi:hypothetical protein